MIPSLALESGYGAGRCRGHEPRIRRDGDELETLPCHARGVLGRPCEDTGGEPVLTCGGQHPFDNLDHSGLVAVRPRSEGPTKTASRPCTPSISSRFSSASCVSIMAIVTTVSFAWSV